MNLISADSISKSYTEKWLFKNISFGLAKGQKIALVGSNGTGKSTLLKTLTGEIQPDSGKLAMANGALIGYLPQEPELDPNITIKESIFSDDNPVLNVVHQYEKAILDDNFSSDKMQEILDKMELYDAWDYDKKAQQILAKLGIDDVNLYQSSLSGGQKKRVAMAKLLIQKPDILILDEPTNHLDLQAIEWLEDLLNGQNISLIMVTHDRYFLDNVATQIMELERGNLYIHQGNYAYYLEKKSMRETIENAAISKAKSLMAKELEWMRRQPKARGTKSKSRIDAFYKTKEIATQNTSKNELEISVQTSRLGNKIIELKNISAGYGNNILVKDFTYTFKKKDRIGVIGKNGIGKSTLLDVLTESLAPLKGSIDYGTTLKIGYYTQHTNNLTDTNRIIDEVKEIAEYVTLGGGEKVSVSKLLDMFMFPPGMQHTPVAKLSGGERRRLQLLKVLVASPNFLILDEPTNDLDIDTLNVLEEFLITFEGCLLLVSHDRYFMDKLVNQLFVFKGNGKIREYYGNYTDYREEEDFEKEEAVKIIKPEPKTASKTIQNNATAITKKRSFKEQKEIENLEKEITTLEMEKANLADKLNDSTLSYNELSEIAKKIEEVDALLDEKGMRWLELSEI